MIFIYFLLRFYHYNPSCHTFLESILKKLVKGDIYQNLAKENFPPFISSKLYLIESAIVLYESYDPDLNIGSSKNCLF